MRNLKRALSLAVASVMLVGMMVVGTSAASFPDVDESHNTEAIAVLKAVDVMIGNENGDFEPDKNVTRAEMAVVMCNLLGLNSSDFAGYRPFTDVPEWAANNVAACAANGIVSGRGDGIYDPNATVTATEAASMMMRALGYFKHSGDYQPNFESATVQQAAKLRLFDGIGGSANAPLNRNQVAQLALNTLEADMVTFTGDMGFDVGGVSVGYRSAYSPIEDLNNAGNSGYNYTNDTETTHQKQYLQLLEDLYDGKLTKDTNDSDSFGRKAETWSYDGDDIISAPLTADKTYVGEVSAKDIYADLNLKANIAASNVEVFEDSADDSNSTKAINRNDGDTKFGADGQTVEVYYTAASGANPASAKVCIISTYLGVVVDTDYKQDNKTGIRVDVFDESTLFFETTGYQEDDVVLVTIADGEIQAILGEPETVTGEVTRVGTDGALTIDKTKYPQSLHYDEGDGDVIDGADSLDVESSYTLYLDKNGCYLAAVLDEDNSTTSLVYLHDVREGAYLGDGNVIDEKVVATVVYMDGTYKDISVDKVNGNIWDGLSDVTAKKNALDDHEGKLVDLKYDEDDKEYTMTVVSEDYTSTAIDKDVELKTDSSYANFAATANTYLNDSTVYLFVKVKDDDATKIDSVETITGGVSFKVDISEMANSAFAVKTGKQTAEYVVIMAEYEAAEKDILYIKNATKKGNIKDGETYEGYYAGQTEKVEIPVDDSYTGNVSAGGVGFYEYSERSNGNLKVTKVVATDAKDKAGALMNKNITSIENNLIQVVSGFVPYDLAGVKVVDLTDRTKPAENAYGANITTLGALRRIVERGEYTVNVSMYVNGDNEVKALFINTILEVANPTANVTFALTDPTEDVNNTIDVDQTAKTVDVEVENETASVVITGGKTATQTVIVGGAAQAKVSASGTDTAPTYTVNTTDIKTTGGDMIFTLRVTEDNKDAITYTVTVTVAGPAAPAEIGHDTANIEDAIAEAFESNDAVTITGGALAITEALVIDADKTLTIEEGGITGSSGVTVTGTLVVEADGVADTTGITVADTGVATINGNVAKVVDVADGGSLTVTGDVAEVTDNNGTLAIEGTVADVKDNSGDLTVTGTITKLSGATKGTVAATVKIGTVEDVAAGAESVEIDAAVDSVTNITSGTVTFKKAVTAVEDITDGTVTFEGTVGTVEDITDGEVTFEDDVTSVENISGGTVNFAKAATLETAATLGSATINLTTENSVLTIGSDSDAAVDLSGITGLTGVAGSKVTIVGTGVVPKDGVFTDNSDQAITSTITAGDYEWDATNNVFKATA